MSYEILVLIGLTFVPFLELRASIPYGILNTNLHWTTVFLVCVAANAVVGPMVYFFVDKVMGVFLRIKRIEGMYNSYVIRVQKKIKGPVEKYGEWGLAVFIGIPLPGTGSYTGAVAGYLLGVGYRKLTIANLLGVTMAGIIVTAIVLSGATAFNFLVKMM